MFIAFIAGVFQIEFLILFVTETDSIGLFYLVKIAFLKLIFVYSTVTVCECDVIPSGHERVVHYVDNTLAF